MSRACFLYYITDRKAFGGAESSRGRRVLEKISEAARTGIDYIQLREKDLPARELESLARAAGSILGQMKAANPGLKTKLLINSLTDVALASGADGVQLRSEDIPASEALEIWQKGANSLRGSDSEKPTVGVSCHSPAEVKRAAEQGASFAVFGPVFEKKDSRPSGL